MTYIFVFPPAEAVALNKASVEGSAEPSGFSGSNGGGGFEREDSGQGGGNKGGKGGSGGGVKRTAGSLGAHSGMDGTVYTEFAGRKR